MTEKNSSSMGGAAFTALMGFMSAAMGAFFMLAGADVIHLDPESVHAPLWVIAAAGTVFFLAGMMIIFQGIAGPGAEQITLYKWLQYFLVLGMLVSFAAIFIWVGLGPGEREFESSVTLGPVGIIGQGSEFLGRCLFGGFGLVLGFIVIYFAICQPLKILGLKSEQRQSLTNKSGDNDD